MSQERKKLLVIGGLLILSGVFIYSSRISLAASFLGANVIFGMGWAREDAMKVGIMGLTGAGIFIAGLVFGIAGFMKKDQEEGSTMSGRVICPKCGHSNSKHRVTCKKCRVNLAKAMSDN